MTLSKLYSASSYVTMCYVSLTLMLALRHLLRITKRYEDIRRHLLLGAHSLSKTYSAATIYRGLCLTSAFYGMLLVL